MRNKNSRVEISSELHELLDDYIKEQKTKGVKGITQIKVLEQLCKAGLAFQKQPDISGVSISDAIGVIQPPRSYPNEYIPETKSELKAMQEALYEKEKRLIDKEHFLLNKEQSINRKLDDSIKFYENGLRKQPDPTKSIMDKMEYNEKFKGIKEGNDQIRDDIRKMNRDLLRILKEIKSNTQENTFYDKVLPILTTLGVSANAFQQFTKGKDFKLDTVLKDFIGDFGKSPQADTGTNPKDISDNTKKT